MAISFHETEAEQILRKTVREFAQNEIAPHARAWDEEERFPTEIMPKLAELGLLGLRVPEEYGGSGMTTQENTIVIEELARVDGSLALTVASHNGLCSGHILHAGNDAQKKKYLPRLASGQALGAWGLTEPGSGSDAAGMKTRATKTGDRWVMSGSKTFITQGSVGSVYVILASTSPEKKQKGITAFILESGMKGFSVGKHIEKLGCRSSDTAELNFHEVEIPDENRLGEVDHGFLDTLEILDRGRIAIAAMALGLGWGAFEAAKRYAKDRIQFGRPIADNQAIQFYLADSCMELETARLLIRRAAWLKDQGRRTTRESSIAKLWAAQAGMRACDRAIQIHGGYGYTREFPVERALRDCKLCEIGEGTNEVQRLVIARELLAVPNSDEIAALVLAGDVRASARLMRDLDDQRPGAVEVMKRLFPHTGRAFVLGVTGNPGAGKSTVVDALIDLYRKQGKKVGVVAVDPTSPFSGGAILGDRIRMQRHATDPGVFIRSLATRGHLGGLSRSTGEVVHVLDAMGHDVVIVETVGVGQDEVDVVTQAETAVVVTVPGLGDEIQAIKAGILEIADVLVVNKADREGADRTQHDLISMLELRGHDAPPVEIVRTVATSGKGIDELANAVERHRQRCSETRDKGIPQRARRRAEAALREQVVDRLRRAVDAELDKRTDLIDALASRATDPYTAADELVRAITIRT